MKQTCLLVLGMHRSGTSALTGVLSLLDVYLGSDLMKPLGQNPKGFFENMLLYRANEALLKEMGSCWDDIFYNEKKLEKITSTVALEEALEKEFRYSQCFAIKDPRLAYLFPLYEQALKKIDVDIKVIIPVRNPLEVAASLKMRNKFSEEKGILLWMHHFLWAEKFSRAYPRVFTGFDQLMSEPGEVIAQLDEVLNIHLKDSFDVNQSKIFEFLTPDLKHHNIAGHNLSYRVPETLRKIMQWLPCLNSHDYTKQFDSLRKEFLNNYSVFYNNEVMDSLREIPVLKQGLDTHKAELQKSQDILQGKTAELQLSQAAVQAKTTELQQTQAALQGKTAELQQSQAAVQAKTAELQQTQAALQGKTAELQQSQATVQTKSTELQQAQATLQGKTAELQQSKADAQAKAVELQQNLSDIQSLRAGLHERACELQAALSKQEALYKELQETIKKKTALNTELQTVSNNLASRSRQLAECDKALQKQQIDLQSLRNELAAVYTSASWNITRPLRRIKRWIGK